MNLTILDTSCKWNHELPVLWLAYFICLFNLHAEYIMQNAGLDEAQGGIKIAGRNINNLRYADDTKIEACALCFGNIKKNK